MKLNLIALLSALTMAHASAKPLCDASQFSSASFSKGAAAVAALPEFKRWTSRLAKAVTFGPKLDVLVRHQGQCLWNISVYADAGQRLEMWNSFLVHPDGHVSKVQDRDSGEWISLPQWRTGKSLVSASQV